MNDDPRVQHLLDELFDSALAPEEVCGECRELLPEVRHRWQQMCRVRDQLDRLFPPLPDVEMVPQDARPGGAALPRIPGYEVESVLGRGGMGVVYKAWHLRLHRPVALKMLLAGGHAQPQELERFLREAETVAGLRHANIVQIHEAGDVDGRPYFTMEFVEGGSLARKLAGTPQPARQAAALVALVAEAVHAAHQRGIVHRDLKPGNILLTADGMPKLTDFGLARRLEGSAGLTQTGAPLGTPGYMAPEQAEGKSRDVGPAADIYALGAILYEFLTGRPPFRAETAAETLRQVVFLQPVPPSQLNAAVPRDPETICLKCLEKDPRRRYASAAALAEDLYRFQRNEPIIARPVGPLQRVLQWTWRNPTGAALAATALALIGLTSGGGVWLVQQRAERRAELCNEVGTAVDQAVSLRKRFHFHEARELLEQARQRLGAAGPEDVRLRVEQALAELELTENLDAARMRAATPLHGTFEPAGAEPLYEDTFAKAGLGRQEDDSEAVAARVRGSAVRAEIVAGLDDWASITRNRARRAWLLAVARGADPDPLRDRLRQPELWRDGPALTQLVRELGVDELSPQLSTALGRVLPKTHGEAVPLLSAAQARHPQDFWLNYELAWALYDSRRSDEALGFYRASLALRPEASQAHNSIGLTLGAMGRLDEAIAHFRESIRLDPNASAAAHSNLGLALYARGQKDEAISHYKESIRLDPKASATAHGNLGEALRDMGRLDEAISHFQESIRLDPKKSATAHNNLGLALYAKGQKDEAISHYRESIRLDPKASATAHSNLGEALRDKGQLDEAISHFRESIRLDPKASSMQHNNLGLALRTKGEQDEAISHFRESSRLDPKASAVAHHNLGCLLREKGRLDEAVVEFQQALELDPKLALTPYYLYISRYAAASAAVRASVSHGTEEKRPGEQERAARRRQALDWLRPNLELRSKLLKDGKAVDLLSLKSGALSNWQTDPDLAGVRDREALAKLPEAEREQWQRLWQDVSAQLTVDPLEQGRAHAARREWTKSADCYAHALKLGSRDEGHFWFEYAAVLLLSGDRPGYASACEQMCKRCGKAPGLRGYHVARACTLGPDAVAEASLTGRLAEAELKAAAGEFWSLTEQGAMDYRAGKFQQAIALFEQSLRTNAKPGGAVVNWLWLALAQQRLGRAEEAQRWLRKAATWLDQYSGGMPERAEEELGLHLHNWMEAHVLRREAEAMIRSVDPR